MINTREIAEEYRISHRVQVLWESVSLYDGNGDRIFKLDRVVDGEQSSQTNCSNHKVDVDMDMLRDVMFIPNGITLANIDKYDLTGYINDVNQQYTQTLMEYGKRGNTVNIYDYGVQRNSGYALGSQLFYAYDGRGSVANLLSAGGQSRQNYVYNEWGRTVYGNTHAGGYLSQPYQYNAEQTDVSTGLQYLRARYYNPNSGRFMQQDTVLGYVDNPITRNLFIYCSNNPVNFIDPSGNNAEDIIDFRYKQYNSANDTRFDWLYPVPSQVKAHKEKEVRNKLKEQLKDINTDAFLRPQNCSAEQDWIVGFLVELSKVLGDPTLDAIEAGIQIFWNGTYHSITDFINQKNWSAKKYLESPGVTPASYYSGAIAADLALAIYGIGGIVGGIATMLSGLTVTTISGSGGAATLAVSIAGIEVVIASVTMQLAGAAVATAGIENLRGNIEAFIGASSTPNPIKFDKINQSNIDSQKDLTKEYFDSLSYQGEMPSGGRSGESSPLSAKPNSYYKTEGGHVVVYNNEGNKIMDISPERVKVLKRNVNPKDANKINWSEKKIKASDGKVEKTEQWILDYFELGG